MQVNVQFGIGEVFSSSTLIFLLILLIGGIPVYLFYYRKPRLMEIVIRSLAPLNIVLEHNYFFDDLYEKVVARGIVKISNGFEYFEDLILSRLPYFAAKGVTALAQSTHKYFDILIDELLYVAANKTVAYSSKLGKTHNESLQRYVVAALLGLLTLIILVIVTMLRVK